MPRAQLEELAAAEAELESEVLSLSGTMEEKARLLQSRGVFGRYSHIFSEYLRLAEAPDPNIEALKRACFIAWYDLTEPACFSGISDLPSDARSRVMAAFELALPLVDSEAKWMLAYYFAVADFAFPELPAYPNLHALIERTDPEGWIGHRSDLDAMRGRGLMGEYWLSVFGSGAA